MTELTGIGAELRRARESQGLAVADVAQQLKFASRQIESLENERFDRLPGPTIARGMVRNYARLLNLDPEPLIERMAPKVEPEPASRPAARFRQPVAFSDGGRRSTLVYAGFSVAVLALVGVVAYEWHQEGAAPQFVAPAPSVAPPVAEKPVEETPVAEKQIVAEAPLPAAPVPIPAEAPKPPVAQKPKPVAAAVAEPAPPAEPREATGEFHRIVLVCEQESWLEVTDGTGRSLVSSLNPAGSERVVRGRGPFEIVIGNARGVRLLVDDKPVDLKPHTRVDVARITIP
ncbi:MAG TPA: RodZ domain-containing protein [Burkholderiales bacterium]|nr:RodZ domain-containing protein [Burkholderiales bacterium]